MQIRRSRERLHGDGGPHSGYLSSSRPDPSGQHLSPVRYLVNRNKDVANTVLIVHSVPTNKVLYVSQRAVLAGYGSTSFAKSLENTEEVHSLFQRNFPLGTMADRIATTFGDEEAFSAATRLFTMRIDAPNETDLEFSDGVDPTGRLERMKGSDLMHLSDNKITYLRRTVDKSSK